MPRGCRGCRGWAIQPYSSTILFQDMNEFTKSILPRMFKHSNFASFVRQLNKYNFHKVKNTDDNQFGEHVSLCFTPKRRPLIIILNRVGRSDTQTFTPIDETRSRISNEKSLLHGNPSNQSQLFHFPHIPIPPVALGLRHPPHLAISHPTCIAVHTTKVLPCSKRRFTG
jgi:hypothetical protein